MNSYGGHDIEDLRPGMQASYGKTISATDIDLFAQASGDNNALHLDEAFAKSTRFGGRIAHGILTAGVVSAALATRLPGPGSVYLAQQLRFRSPVRPGDFVTATVTVLSVDEATAQVTLATECRVGDRVVLEGEAQLRASSRTRPLGRPSVAGAAPPLLSESTP